MTVWREVQEALYGRFATAWGTTTQFALENEPFDPPAGQWCRFSVKSMPGGNETLGSPGNRRMRRVGRVFFQLFEPPGGGVGAMSDLAEGARAIFENCRLEPHDIRFAAIDIGQERDVDDGRWWGVVVEGRFDYEELK